MENKLTDAEIYDILKKYPLIDIQSPVDLRDYTYEMIAGETNVKIPNKFEVNYQLEVKDQGQVAACVNHAISSIKEIIDGVTEYYSQWWLHALRSDSDFQGKGAIVREELKHLVNEGIVPLALFNVPQDYPDIRTTLETKYNKEVLLKEAANHKSTGYIKLNADEIKKYLYNEKKPILLAVKVYENFYQAAYNGGIIPYPSGAYCGGHAMAIVGYNGDTLKILNSWGKWAGKEGYLYLDINNPIIRELWGLTDKPINKPPVKTYKVGWDKEASTGKWIYSEDGLTLVKDDWKQIKGTWYYFKDIYALDGEWIKYKDKWYYLEKSSCAMATNKWIYWGNKWYRVGADGAMLTGWFQDDNTVWYYLDIDKGYVYTNCTILIDGKNYSFDSNGAWIKNDECVSKDLFNFIKVFEGCYLEAYYCPSHVLTIGIGNTNPKWTKLETITEEQAMEAFKEDMKSFSDGVDSLASNAGISLEAYQREALISFSFNVGLHALETSTLWENICNGVTDSETITENFGRWNKGSDGETLPGLVKRRACEAKLFLTGDYSTEV